MKDQECVKKKVKIAPHDYSKKNYLATFTPQKQLTPEKIFWSDDLLKMKDKALQEKAKSAKPIKAMTVYPPNTPAKLVPKVLPTKSQVKVNIYSLVQLFLEFDKTCKKRITPTGLTEGERGFEQTKACYLTEVIPFFKTIKEHFEGIQKALINEIKEMKEVFDQMEAEVDQNAVDKKRNEIERKNLLIENENLIAECLSKDVFYTATDSVLTVSRFSDMHDAYTVAQKCIAELKAKNSNLTYKIQKDDHDEMIKHFSKLEVEHLNLQLKYQHLKERFGNKKSVKSSDAHTFESVFVIGNLKEQLQGRGNTIRELKEKISGLQKKHSEADLILDFKALDSQNKDLNAKVNALQDLNERFRVENKKVKQHYKELYDSIKLTCAKTIEKATSLLTKIKTLKAQIKGKMKCVIMPDPVKPNVLAPGMYAIDVEPIPPRNRNNKEVHPEYLKHLKESVGTLREIVEEARVEKPLDSSLASALIKNGYKVRKRTVGEIEQEYEPTTAKEKQDRRNEMKARGTLLMALPNKDQLKFHSYKDAKLLMEAIEKRYGGNKESKKVQRTLLKQQYENFAGLSSEIMDQTFDRLQKLISQLEIQGEVITQEDMNLKLLRSLPSEWKTHDLIWRNKQEIVTISLDDLYKNLKIYEPEILGSSTDNTTYGVSAAHTQSNPTSGDNLSDAVICAFLASQPNSPQLSQEDLEQINPDDLEEMDLQWEMAMLTIRARRFIKRTGRKLDVNGQRVGFDRSKVECYNCHKYGHFARECRDSRNQENRGREINRRIMTVETPAENALVALDGIGGYDWSY
ncbi:integrase, catalytic region, zinc finger, CCHC-type containing protein [Tanacetum coccineum]